MPDAWLALVLHAHLPFVRHPEHTDFLEERWFFEALSETYLPLLAMFSRLEEDGVPYRLLLSLSPTLVSMMEDPLLCDRYLGHLDKTIRLADREARRHGPGAPYHAAAAFHADFYRDARYWFIDKAGGRVARALGRVAAAGRLELMTCAATHGFLPFLANQPGAVRAQLQTAADYHQSVFGVRAEGVWLPECAYVPGLERQVADAGFRYTFVDAPCFEKASPVPPRGLLAPVYAGNQVAFFARDRETSHQVWAAEMGYPGHPDYREFHRDRGWDLPEAEVAEFMAAGARTGTGLKFNRVTGKVEKKEPYDPARAREMAARHAGDFAANRERQSAWWRPRLDRPPLVTAMYDAELFGHWWFEGVWFLDYALRKIAYDTPKVALETPGRYLARHPENTSVQLAAGSWGRDGTFEYWANPQNDAILPLLDQAAGRFGRRARELAAADARSIGRAVDAIGGAAEGEDHALRAVKQMSRELLLAQASDWPFIMKTGTSPDYARRRVESHLARFRALDAMLQTGFSRPGDIRRLATLEAVDAIFPDIDPRHFLEEA